MPGPVQPDNFNCGVFAIAVIEHLKEGANHDEQTIYKHLYENYGSMEQLDAYRRTLASSLKVSG